MKDYLEKLIRTVEETQLVERLMNAKNTNEGAKIRMDAAETSEFKEFMEHYGEVVGSLPEDVDYIISSDDFVCTAQNVVALATICIIECIDVQDLFDIEGYELFIVALEEVTGAQKWVSEKLLWFFGIYEYRISDFELEELFYLTFSLF